LSFPVLFFLVGLLILLSEVSSACAEADYLIKFLKQTCAASELQAITPPSNDTHEPL